MKLLKRNKTKTHQREQNISLITTKVSKRTKSV